MPKKKKPRLAGPATPLARHVPPALDLEKVRGQIDSIDEKIHSLINDRARLAQLVGISKTREGRTVDFYRPEREAQVLRMARERNSGPLRDE
jgi:chorismate mutase/prephenate dehydratase